MIKGIKKYIRDWRNGGWRDNLGKVMSLYNRSMFYQNFAKQQILQPLGLFNEALWILTYLAVIGIHPSWGSIATTYLIVLILLVAIGKFLVFIGWMRYLQKLSNGQNDEIMKIKEDVAWIRENLNK